MRTHAYTCAGLCALAILAGCRPHTAAPDAPAPDAPAAAKSDRDRAIAAAQKLFQQKKAAGVDMTNGPCLGDVAPDWCADVAHNPRQPVDNLPQNQCASYRSGKVHHFVELDPNGKLIRAQ